MPKNTSRLLTLTVLPLTLAVAALTGCAAGPHEAPKPAAQAGSSDAESSGAGSAADNDGQSASDEDFAILLGLEQAGVAILTDQWTNNGCSVDLAFSPDDIVCADILAGADLTVDYADLTGGLDTLPGDPAAADELRSAFSVATDAGTAWRDAGCADELTEACADEGEELIASLLALDTAFDAWAA